MISVKLSAQPSPENVAKFSKFIGELIFKRAAVSAADRLISIILNEIIPTEPYPPVDIGLYRASFKRVILEDSVAIMNTAPYAPMIEYGVKAENVKIGGAMLQALEEWVVRKLGVSKDEAPKTAWAVALSLKKRGIFHDGKGLHIMGQAFEVAPEVFQQELNREIERAMRELQVAGG